MLEDTFRESVVVHQEHALKYPLESEFNLLVSSDSVVNWNVIWE